MRDTPRPGEVFEGHLIEGEIGRGGMGMVFRARNIALERPRAIKVIAPELSADPAYAARFRRESRLAASVEHPNIVVVHGAGEDDGLLFIVMRLVEGVDLHRLLADGALPPARAIPILEGVAAALDAAHRAGLVHRDVKPANVLIESRAGAEHVYLTDFGISKPTSTKTAGGTERTSEAALTLEGQVLGTADYVAPEQVEHGTSDARSDVYSLACVAYHVLTGAPPFRRDTEIATLIAQTKAERPSARAANGRLPGGADDILRTGMAIDPDERPQSAGAFAERLSAVLGGRHDPVAASDRSELPTAMMTRPGRAGRQGSSRRRVALIAGGIVLLAVGAAAAFALLRGGGGVEAPTVVTERVGESPVGVAVGDKRVWVASRDESHSNGDPPGEVERLYLAKPVEAKEPISVPSPRSVAIGPGTIWVVNGEALYAIDTGSGEPPRRIEVGAKPDDVAVDNNFVWVSNEEGDSVTRVDPGDLRPDGEPTTLSIDVGDEPRSIAADRGLVWVANAGSGTVSKIDADRHTVIATVPVGSQPTSIAVGPSSVWVTDNAANDMRQIDVRDAKVVGDPIPVAASPRGVAVGLSSVWVASGAENVVERYDANTRMRIGDPIPVGPDPADVAVGDTAVYTANQASGSVSRIVP